MPLLRSSVLRASILSLGVCAFALPAALPADAAKSRAVASAKKRPIKAKPAAPAVDNAAITGRNADGSLHSPTLEDAPKEDFLRVAWCHGILSGNMEMAEIVDSIMPIDDQIQTIGVSYLRAYEAALTLSGKGKDAVQHKKAEEVRDYGYNEWAAARAAPTPEAAYAYANWQLPGDCEHAAVRLSGHPNLFAEMATDKEMDAIELALNSGGPHDYTEKPKPILTAQSAPVDGDGPVASNTLGRRVNAATTLPVLPTAVSDEPADRETTLPAGTVPNPNHVEKRKWSEGLGYRLGWADKPKQ